MRQGWIAPSLYGGRAVAVAHTTKYKSKLIARVRRIAGQVEAVERALGAEIGCADILMLVASLRGAVTGLSTEVMEDHIRSHVSNPDTDPDAERAKSAAELIEVVRTCLKHRPFIRTHIRQP